MRRWVSGNMSSIAIVDSGPLIAVANRADPDHERCLEIKKDTSLRLIIPALCVAEVTFLLGRRAGPDVESRFLNGLRDWDVRAPAPREWPRISELVRMYADLPLGGTDAAAISLAESLQSNLVVTLDRRHFGVVKPRHVERLRLLPE